MSAWVAPTDEQVEAAVLQIAAPQAREHFFLRLENPLWVGPLLTRGFFAEPSEAVTQPDGSIGWYQWPQSRYLARAAADAPEDVASVIAAMPRVTNPLVLRDLADALRSMPTDLSAPLIETLVDWLDAGVPDFIHLGDLAELAERLMANGFVESGVALAALVLNTPGHQYDYDDAVHRVGVALGRLPGMSRLLLIADALDDELGASGNPPTITSSIWRPSIEESRGYSNRADALVDALRDALIEWAREGDRPDFERLIQKLEERSQDIFQRVALWFLTHAIAHADEIDARYGAIATELAATRVMTPELLATYGLAREYADLFRATLAAMNSADFASWINLVLEGAEQAARDAADSPEEGGIRTLRNDAELAHDYFLRDKLALGRGRLSATDLDRVEALEAAYGPAVEPGIRMARSTFVGPMAPVTEEDLSLLTPKQVVELAEEWTPSDEWGAPSADGLAMRIADTAKIRASEFSVDGQAFLALPLIYVDGLMRGLRDGADQGATLDAEATLEVIEAALAYEDTGDLRQGGGPYAFANRWAHRSAAALLSALLRQQPGLSTDLAGRVVSALEALSRSPDPSTVAAVDDSMDPFMRALNSVRGQGALATLEAVGWVSRTQEAVATKEPATPEEAQHLGDAATRLQALVNDALKPQGDQHPAVWAAYGSGFPNVAVRMPDLAAAVRDELFGVGSDGVNARHAAARDGLLHYTRPVTELLELTRPLYASWVSDVASLSGSARPLGSSGSTAERLGEHVLLLYLWGAIDLDDVLVVQLFERADLPTRRAILDHLGWLLWRSGEDGSPISGEMARRAERLWTWRRVRSVETGEAAQYGSRSELGVFGWWLATDVLDAAWRLDEFELGTEVAGRLDNLHHVFETLGTMTIEDDDVARTLRAVGRQVVDADHQIAWAIEEARPLLVRGLRAPADTESRRAADAVVEALAQASLTDLVVSLQREAAESA